MILYNKMDSTSFENNGDQIKRKKKRKQDQNPLSNARKQNNMIESLWHRKSGLGYDLFLSYYSGQPKGIVHNYDDETKEKKLNISTQQQGNGLSRASKKRKRRKKDKQEEEEEEGKASNSSTPTSIQNETSKLLNSSSPLVQALLKRQQKNDNQFLFPFIETLSRPLPLTFRIRATATKDNVNSFIQQLSPFLQNKILKSLMDCDHHHQQQQQIYQATSISKKELSRTYPALAELLLQYSTNGTIARQELGSMLPVISLHSFLQKRVEKLYTTNKKNKGIQILDMCASPGSKTLQILEQVILLQRDGKLSKKNTRIIANDVHPKRIETLKEAIDRSTVLISAALNDDDGDTKTNMMTANDNPILFFTNHDASLFPMPSNQQQRNKKARPFDFILCDVPCSGDGTVRKDKTILPMWTPRTSNALHSLQVKILHRAIELLHPNRGMVCYSTCSLNPIENEAVVASVLQKWKDDDVEVVKWKEHSSTLLPDMFRSKPGVLHWKVADWKLDDDKDEDDEANVTWYDNYQDAIDDHMTDAHPSQWPASSWSTKMKENLQNCIRLWPHDMDNGGFFVALIRRKK